MNELEDLRGERLEWIYKSGYPLDVNIVLGDRTVGRLWRETNLRTKARGEMLGLSFWLDWRSSGFHQLYQVGFEGSETLLVKSKLDFLGHHRLKIDGVRPYRLERRNYNEAAWMDSRDVEAVDFSIRHSSSSEPQDGSILIQRTAEEIDVAPLVLLGVLMAMDGALFQRNRHYRP